jgi:hypothetical protein
MFGSLAQDVIGDATPDGDVMTIGFTTKVLINETVERCASAFATVTLGIDLAGPLENVSAEESESFRMNHS